MTRVSKIVLLMVAAVTLLIGCAPLVNLVAPRCPNGYSCERTGGQWLVQADAQKPAFVIASSEDIGVWSSRSSCKFRPVQAGPRRVLECVAPNVVQLETRGEIQVLTLESVPIGAP